MSNKMLIDASHPEETRVVVLRGNKVEEFDFEAAGRQQLRGNIYLAKVTRVEPSLQAAFVEYGGNRHGFLAFSEIHPDYYQIPYADRRALLEEQAREEVAEAAVEEHAAEASPVGESEGQPHADAPTATNGENSGEDSGTAEAANYENAAFPSEANSESHGPETVEESDSDTVEQIGAEDALEELPRRNSPRPRQYKIQEVIKRRQVLLVQVVKEERGTKGAALTTYLSLAGRYSVLMPNTARGGGISRKITSAADRKRLKELASELDVPEGMGVILRTAGANRTKTEIKRDFEYLLRLWETVRDLTLRSTAPMLVYEEGSLIKRSIRDLYSREIDSVLVAGDDAYREAKDFMRMLMPSHAKNVQAYKENAPIFARNGVEQQLNAMFSPRVNLKSGGTVVLNQTEALVAIDVNSGRSTREHSIEDTALQTNLEASEEIARQLRLRDLAGLIVIDFIDMEEKRNNRAVERKLKDCLRADRARIQLGRISHFGLLEMSRQRIRTGVLESSTEPCHVCHGIGQVRSVPSLALQILRTLEDHLLRQSDRHVRVHTRLDVALYILNQKRAHLSRLEERFALSITVVADTPGNGAAFVLDLGELVERREAPQLEAVAPVQIIEVEDKAEIEEFPEEQRPDEDAEARRGRGRDGRGRHRRAASVAEEAPVEDPEVEEADAADTEDVESVGSGERREARNGAESDEEAQSRKRRRRGRRGGRRRGRAGEEDTFQGGAETEAAEPPSERESAATDDAEGEGAQYPGISVPDIDPLEPNAHGVRLNDRDAEARDEREGTPIVAALENHYRLSVEVEKTASDAADASGLLLGERSEEAASSSTPASSDNPVAETSSAIFNGESEPVTRNRPDENVTNRRQASDEEPTLPQQDEGAARNAGRAPEPATPVQDDRPKRSGWWQRRSFF